MCYHRRLLILNQEPFSNPLEIWRGNPEAAEDAQRMLYFRAKLNQAAREGKYLAEMGVKEANNKILKSRSH